MSNYTQRSRRSNRGNRSNKILNILIGVVVVLIFITIAFIFVDGDDPAEDKASETESVKTDVSNDKDDAVDDGDEQDKENATDLPSGSEPSDETGENSDESTSEVDEDAETVTLPDEGQSVEQPSDDPIVEKTITNPSWRPVGTSQTGSHVSSYDKNSVDWTEKEKALAYATGLAQDNMIVWFLGNGGSPQKSIGTVSSKDQAQKYRVYLEWIDGEGWKPVKMDVLTTLEGAKNK